MRDFGDFFACTNLFLVCNDNRIALNARRRRHIAADYDLAARAVTVTGNPVVLSDRDGNQVKGRRLLYEIDGGAMKVLSEAR